jgi:alkylated DNA nucleotide flippase Atl1
MLLLFSNISGKKRFSVATYGWIMKESPNGVPAQRVINSKGESSGSWTFVLQGRECQLLEEGIIFSKDERVDMKHYGWNRLVTSPKKPSSTPVKPSERLL